MKKFISLMLTVSITAVMGCQKYPEGPFISLRSAKDRLYGNYTLTKYTINGIDSIQQMKDRFGLSSHLYYDDYYQKDVWSMDDPLITNQFSSFYFLEENNKSIRINYGSVIFTGNGNFNHQDVYFTILKLTNKEIHLETTYNDKLYYLELN